MKPQFKNVFKNTYKEANKDLSAAITLCEQLEDPIKNYVIDSVTLLVVDEMRGTYSWIKTKRTFIAKVLLEIGNRLAAESLSDGAFSLCTTFLTDADNSLRYWAKQFTECYCTSHLDRIALRALSDIIDSIVICVRLQKQPFSLNDWLEVFRADVEKKLKIRIPQLTTLCALEDDQTISDVNFFTQEIEDRLEEMKENLTKTLSSITYSQTKQTSHENIYDQIAGCTSQCPFCKAQCELTTKNHQKMKHATQHRPGCLGRYQWTRDKTMHLDICTFAVASNCTFTNKDTKGNIIPYRKYRDYYPEWSIPADKSLEASLYWKWFIGH